MFWVFLSFHFSKKEERNRYLKVFQELDKNGDGTLSVDEIVKGIINLQENPANRFFQLIGYQLVNKFSTVNIQEIIRMVDTNQNGQIDFTGRIRL